MALSYSGKAGAKLPRSSTPKKLPVIQPQWPPRRRKGEGNDPPVTSKTMFGSHGSRKEGLNPAPALSSDFPHLKRVVAWLSCDDVAEAELLEMTSRSCPPA